MPIRIVSIVPYPFLPAHMGGQKGVALFSEYLGKLLPLTIIGTQNNDKREARNFKLLPILSANRIRYANIFLFFSVRKILKQEKATHLLIEHPYYGWLAWMIKITSGIPVVVHSHNIEFERSKSIGRWWWKALQWYESWVYRWADSLFFISEDDRNYGIEKLGLNPAKCHTITYGVEIAQIPMDRQQCRDKVFKKHHIDPDNRLLLFNGSLSVNSNYDAVRYITDYINPILLRQPIPYKILICGKGLPASFQELKNYKQSNIIYAGFVEDISLYFKATDIFLNPILSGAGIKTKIVEAIAYNCHVVSTQMGALGMDRHSSFGKLSVVADGDWNSFATSTIELLSRGTGNTPEQFYQQYFWGEIAQKAKKALEP